MKRTLCGLAAFLIACCTFCACSEAPPPPPPPQSEFVQAVNEALKQEKTVRYICGLQESEVLCEEAQKLADIIGQVECTDDKTGEEKIAVGLKNIQCFASFVRKKSDLKSEGLYVDFIADSKGYLTPEDVAEKIACYESQTFTQIGWSPALRPAVDRNGFWDGITANKTYVLVLSTQPILDGTMGEGGLTGTLPQGENTEKTNEPEPEELPAPEDLPAVPVQ